MPTSFRRTLSSELSNLASRLLGGLLGGSSREGKKLKKKEGKGEDDVVVDDAIHVLQDFVEKTAAKGPEALIKEYTKIDQFCDSSATFEAFAANMPKNRYSDVVCKDQTRVRLKLDPEAGDYIHANYIDHPALLNKFICTQGPLSSTIYDFWRMIFQERVHSILMLCRPAEDGRPKCVIYWPQNVGEKIEFSSITVTNRGEEEDQFSPITLIVEFNPTFEAPELSEADKAPLVVKLFRWTSWPDRGVPDRDTSWEWPIKLLDKFEVRSGPAVVHCSAGIGRTGSLLVLEIALQRIGHRKHIDIEQITRDLRKCRCQCVQNEVQYLYIHRVLVENAARHVHMDQKYKDAAAKFLAAYDDKLKIKAEN